MVIFFYLYITMLQQTLHCGIHYITQNSTTLNCQSWFLTLDLFIYFNWKKKILFPIWQKVLLANCCIRTLLLFVSHFLIWSGKTKRLVVIAQLSVFISQVTPLSGHASVRVVKAVYEQWPDMKPRLLWLCKQPHLFEPTCSPAFTSLINNEISLRYYYDCIRNIAVATLLQNVCTI